MSSLIIYFAIALLYIIIIQTAIPGRKWSDFFTLIIIFIGGGLIGKYIDSLWIGFIASVFLSLVF